MPYHGLRERVCAANRELGRSGLVVLTWGNVSEIDREAGVFAIKPSGIEYEDLTTDQIVVISLESGEQLSGDKRPSSDTDTHRELYLAFDRIGGIVHTHSTYATAWAQTARPIPCLGTTHADTFSGSIPVTRTLSSEEIDAGYEAATGRVIAEHFTTTGTDPHDVPGVLLPYHGPFVWGARADDALEHAIILEEIARMAYLSRTLAPTGPEAPEELVRKHFQRKHGPGAYYGQAGADD